MKKRVIALLLTAIMAVSLLAGCGSNGKVKINIYRPVFNLAQSDDAQVAKVQAAINAYLAELGKNYEVSITETGSGEYVEKAGLALANKEINLLWTASWESGKINTANLVKNGDVMDITELLKGSTVYNSMAAGQWAATTYDGKNFFMPVYKDNVEGYDLMFRSEVVAKHGWDLSKVKTLKDLETTGILADAKADGLKYPLLLQKTALFYRFYIDSFDFFTADVTANWISVDRKTNSVVNTVQTPEYKEYASLVAAWREAGYISEDDFTKVTTDTTTQTKDWAVSWWTDIPFNTEANSRYGQDVEMVALTSEWAHSNSALGSCYCITANTDKKTAEAVIDFMGVLYTDTKLADMYTFGIEGEDFKYVTDDAGNKFIDNAGADKYNHGMWESVSVTALTPSKGEPANKGEQYNAWNSAAQTSCAAGFRFDNSSVSAEFAACQDVFNEIGFALETGGVASKDIDAKIAEYQSKLDAAGYQKVLAEAQAQYDAWKK